MNFSQTVLRASVSLKVSLPVARKSLNRRAIVTGVVVGSDIVEIYERTPVFSWEFSDVSPLSPVWSQNVLYAFFRDKQQMTRENDDLADAFCTNDMR